MSLARLIFWPSCHISLSLSLYLHVCVPMSVCLCECVSTHAHMHTQQVCVEVRQQPVNVTSSLPPCMS